MQPLRQSYRWRIARLLCLLTCVVVLHSAFPSIVHAQAQPGSSRTFKTICAMLHVQGKDLLADCAGTLEFVIPSAADLKAGARPTIRAAYGGGKMQVWELGEPQALNDPNAVVIKVAKVDGTPGAGRCYAKLYGGMAGGIGQVGLTCTSFVEAQGISSDYGFDAQYTNARGGTATGSPLELLDYVKSVSVLLGGQPLPTPNYAGAAAPPASSAASPTPSNPVASPAAGGGASPNNANSAANSKPATPAATAEPFKPSTDPKAIFGLMVGTRRPMTLPVCKHKDAFSRPTFAPDQAYCFSELGTGLNALVGGLKESLTMDDYQKLGILPMEIIINEQIYDIRIAETVTIFSDKNNIIQRVKVVTFLVSHDDIMKMLTGKYGKPAKEDWTPWTNRQTGAVIDRTPNYYWDFPEIFVDYVSRTASLLNTPTGQGNIDVYTEAYTRMVSNYLKQRDGPAPGRKPM